MDEYTKKIPYEFHPIPIRSRSLNPFHHLAVITAFIRIFRKVKPDIALLYTIQPNIYGNIAARLAGVRTISNIAGLGNVFIDKRFATRVAKALYKTALGHSETVFFQNHEDMALFRKLGLVSPGISTRIPGSGVDTERFAPVERPNSQDGEPFIFLLATRMLWEKGVGEFARAAKRLKQEHNNIVFRLVGPLKVENPTALTTQDMKKLLAEGAVEYGGVSGNIEREIARADCVVLPSYREGLPKILLEAAAMAKPIITTRVPGCMDVVEDGVNGFLCEPRDARDLGQKMQAMLNLHDQTRATLGACGRKKIVREFHEGLVFDCYKQAIWAIEH